MNIDKKNILSPCEILRQAREHSKGGAKPDWAGKTVYVGQKAVQDWTEFKSRSTTGLVGHPSNGKAK